MYTKEDVIKFATYVLSEERTRRIELSNLADTSLRGKLLTVTEEDFDAVWPPIKHELTQEDLDVNGPIVTEEGVQLQVGDEIKIPTSPHVTFDVPEAPIEGTYQAPSEN